MTTTAELRYSLAVDVETPLDRGISYAVKVLRDAGVETFESCEGGAGHSFFEPTIRFYGVHADGFRALSVALMFGLPVRSLHRSWRIEQGEPTGPNWELTFWRPQLERIQKEAEETGLID